MIRRMFWLTLGAVLGVTGYRRATRFARSVSPAARAAKATRFAADVRDGMRLYMERHPEHSASTLGSRQEGELPGELPGGLPADRVSRIDHVKDGR